MDLIRQFFLEAFPNPQRIDCPGEEIIMALAGEELPPDHPACLHVASCSECFAEFTGCILELKKSGDSNSLKSQDPPPHRGPDWSEIASAVSEEDLLSVALQRLRERIALYRRRREKQGT
jgi:hypothetical protein